MGALCFGLGSRCKFMALTPGSVQVKGFTSSGASTRMRITQRTCGQSNPEPKAWRGCDRWRVGHFVPLRQAAASSSSFTSLPAM